MFKTHHLIYKPPLLPVMRFFLFVLLYWQTSHYGSETESKGVQFCWVRTNWELSNRKGMICINFSISTHNHCVTCDPSNFLTQWDTPSFGYATVFFLFLMVISWSSVNLKSCSFLQYLWHIQTFITLKMFKSETLTTVINAGRDKACEETYLIWLKVKHWKTWLQICIFNNEYNQYA